MNIVSFEDVLPLTPHAFYVLLALARAPMSAYDVYDQCVDDSQSSIKFSRRNLYRTVYNMEKWGFAEAVGEYPSQGSMYNKTIFQITDSGKLVLNWEATRYQEAAVLALQRQHHIHSSALPQF